VTAQGLIMLPFVLTLYGLACAGFLSFLLASREKLARAGRLAFAAGFIAHTIDIAIRCVHGLHPVATTPEAMSFAAWLIALGYLIIALRYPIAAVGAFVAPVSLVLVVLARVTPAGGPRSGALSALGRVHITLSTAGLALFALAAAAAVIYLVSESQLKSKKFGLLFHRGPPLATLDLIGHRCITVGFPVFTVAIVTGAIWVARLRQGPLRPEYPLSMVTWLAFAALLVARTTAGWQGRRAAWLTLAGFGGALAVVLIYLLRYAATGA
jgi:ABC-type uncharacterized transport system permease subunit